MSFKGMLVHDIYIVTPGAMVDRYGDTLPDWNNATRVAAKAWIYLRDQGEDHAGGRNADIQEWRAYIDGTQTVSSGNRIEWPVNNLTFEVDGPPRYSYRPQSASPELHHYEAELRHVSG